MQPSVLWVFVCFQCLFCKCIYLCIVFAMLLQTAGEMVIGVWFEFSSLQSTAIVMPFRLICKANEALCSKINLFFYTCYMQNVLWLISCGLWVWLYCITRNTFYGTRYLSHCCVLFCIKTGPTKYRTGPHRTPKN